jgi:hypothetical protein
MPNAISYLTAASAADQYLGSKPTARMDARPNPRKQSSQERRPSDRPAETFRESERAIEAATRCWLLHRWSPWTLYETVRPVRAIGPSLRHVAEVAEMRRRRHCVRCGKRNDRYVGQKSVPADQPQPAPRGFATIEPGDRPISPRRDRAD